MEIPPVEQNGYITGMPPAGREHQEPTCLRETGDLRVECLPLFYMALLVQVLDS